MAPLLGREKARWCWSVLTAATAMTAPLALGVAIGAGFTAIELPVPLDVLSRGDFARTLISTCTLHLVFLMNLEGLHGDNFI